MGILDTRQDRFPDLEPAFRALEEFVAEHVRAGDGRKPEVSVYVFGEPPHGVRVAELSCWWPAAVGRGGSGSSWMRSEANEHGNVLICAEDFLLNYGADPDWEDPPGEKPIVDNENEARWRLVLALTGETGKADAAWVERRPPA